MLALTISETADNAAFVRKSLLPANGYSSAAHQSVLPVRYISVPAGSAPVTAVISAASRHIMMPSLSVDHGVPSKRREGSPCALFATKAEAAVEQTINKTI
ncbi:hypothetical protein DMH88_02030 [Escherichia coli]|nr:hypothetical protein [Escherichia coli]